MKSVSIILLAGLWFSCSKPPTIYKRVVTTRSEDRLPSSLSVSFAEQTESDGYENTFAVLPIGIEAEGTVSFERQLLVKGEALDEAQLAPLKELCSDIDLIQSVDSKFPVQELSKDSKPLLSWRTHFPAETKDILAQAIGSRVIRCNLQVRLDDGRTSDIVFDPVPTDLRNILGTSQSKKAVDEVLMMIDIANSGTTLSDGHGYEIYTLSDPADLRLNVPAMNGSELEFNLLSDQTLCRYHNVNGADKIGNPDEIHTISYESSQPKAVLSPEFSKLSTGGRELKSCEDVELKLGEDQKVNLDLSCANYLAIAEAGFGDTCGWRLSLANADDPKNSVRSSLRLTEHAIDTVDANTVQGAASIIKKADNNPIQNNTLDVATFNETQADVLARAFDFWISASPTSYSQLFENKIAKITYMGTSGAACSEEGVLAYVESLQTTEIFWCQTAGMSAQAVQEQNSPFFLMLISVTALHEGLHAIGREHDFDAPAFEPCKGTSESAVISFDTIVNCKEDSCFAMKQLSLREYISELDYSLEADARRFQGQCQIWNDGLGLTAANFNS